MCLMEAERCIATCTKKKVVRTRQEVGMSGWFARSSASTFRRHDPWTLPLLASPPSSREMSRSPSLLVKSIQSIFTGELLLTHSLPLALTFLPKVHVSAGMAVWVWHRYPSLSQLFIVSPSTTIFFFAFHTCSHTHWGWFFTYRTPSSTCKWVFVNSSSLEPELRGAKSTRDEPLAYQQWAEPPCMCGFTCVWAITCWRRPL